MLGHQFSFQKGRYSETEISNFQARSAGQGCDLPITGRGRTTNDKADTPRLFIFHSLSPQRPFSQTSPVRP